MKNPRAIREFESSNESLMDWIVSNMCARILPPAPFCAGACSPPSAAPPCVHVHDIDCSVLAVSSEWRRTLSLRLILAKPDCLAIS